MAANGTHAILPRCKSLWDCSFVLKLCCTRNREFRATKCWDIAKTWRPREHPRILRTTAKELRTIRLTTTVATVQSRTFEENKNHHTIVVKLTQIQPTLNENLEITKMSMEIRVVLSQNSDTSTLRSSLSVVLSECHQVKQPPHNGLGTQSTRRCSQAIASPQVEMQTVVTLVDQRIS